MRSLYLLHFDRRLHHAGHYAGLTEDLERRLKQHARGQGARLMEVLLSLGIEWQLVRLWRNPLVTFSWEGTLKAQKNGSYFCPVCNPFAERQFNNCDDYPLELLDFNYTSQELRGNGIQN